MKKEEFMEMVIKECRERSYMSYTFSKRKLKMFKRWFFRQGRKHFKWSKWKCNYEWEKFIEAFNIRIE